MDTRSTGPNHRDKHYMRVTHAEEVEELALKTGPYEHQRLEPSKNKTGAGQKGKGRGERVLSLPCS